ncbi:hypothetical protein K5X82_08675 [Halosquirtibacter xylanolyticus]|uniref:hypothetical protein n=1 Tax=Halosquirtibacter xylanolyticus TaxID=3374599 RepID=UPI0037488AFD|nr:hypothetical protein K5X82_08675 [Prolixibacteraceae bacterium]
MKAVINMNPHGTKYKVVGAIITIISVAINLYGLDNSNSWIKIALFATTFIGVLLYTNIFNLNTCNIILQPKSMVIKWKGRLRPEWIHINFMKSWGMNDKFLFVETNKGRKEYCLRFLTQDRRENLKEALSQYSHYIDIDFMIE